MIFSDRVKISEEYREWLTKENEKNNFDIPFNPESFMDFLEMKGYLSEKTEQIAKCDGCNAECEIDDFDIEPDDEDDFDFDIDDPDWMEGNA